MKLVLDDTENVEIYETANRIFNIADLKGTSADTVYTTNCFRKQFGATYFLMTNNVFESEQDYEQLIKFLKGINETRFYIQGIYNGEYKFKTIIAGVEGDYKQYNRYINSEWVDGSFDFERDGFGGIPLLGDYILMFGTDTNWAMVHDRYNDLITIAIDSSLEIPLQSAFGKKLFDVDTVIKWLGRLAGGELLEELQMKLRTWYPKGNLQLPPFKFTPWE